MMGYTFYSYLLATLAYAVLLLASLLRKNRQPRFIFASTMSLLWCLSILRTTVDADFYLANTLVFETVRNASWLFFLIGHITSQSHRPQQAQRSVTAYPLALMALTGVLASIESFPELLDFILGSTGIDPRFSCHLLYAVLGLILIEQWYRNTSLEQRWSIKFSCIGLGILFMVDFLVFSKSLLYTRLDYNLWQNRGLINAMIAIFLIIGQRRLTSLQPQDVTNTPRKIVFHTTVLFGCGLYLILMSMTGFYLKHMNAEWGESAQTLFIFLALVLLITAFTSGKIRALAKVYFNQHFFHYSYDYRSEWLKISQALAQIESPQALKQFTLTTLSDLVDSSGGGLWLKNDQGQFILSAEHNLRLTPQENAYLQAPDSLTHYLSHKRWVIDFIELAHSPESYEDIDLSAWCHENSEVWLITPLFHLNTLEAFVILTQPRVSRRLNWEDHDVLKTVGMQLANALALSRASDELAKNKQFEAYHRLSAFLVHDLKNITAQLSMIVTNANRHKHNPAFIDDALITLDNAVGKMQKMVEQLKQGTSHYADSVIDLSEILPGIRSQLLIHPPVDIEISCKTCHIQADKTKLVNILANLVKNAQEAAKHDEGLVKVTLSQLNEHALIKIIDNGQGMSPQFISERLFKPFDTTKGNAGMGIGAYEARDYILKCNGQLSVESEPEQGTVFTIHWPLFAAHTS